MKKIFKKILVFPFVITCWVFFGAEKSFANSCVIQNGPVPEMQNYASRLQAELSKIQSDAMAKNPTCENRLKPKISYVFDGAYADLNAFSHIHTDFIYNSKVAFQGATKTPIRRDQKFFDSLEKNIEKVVENLAHQCAIDSEIQSRLRELIRENQNLRYAYQKAAIGAPITSFSSFRQDSISVVEAMNSAYSPQAVISCQNNTKTEKTFSETLKSALNFGAKKEDALSTWRKAIAMIRGGGNGMSASEVAARQRSLLQAELSRQGLSSNAKDAILKNFDCYKSKTLASENPENFVEARAECLQIPVTGVNKLFEYWNNFTWQASNSDEWSRRNEVRIERETRSVNIEGMYSILRALTVQEELTNDNTMKWLIDLHVNLQNTNSLLESRIPAAQKNCMKWQPDVVGGCK